MTLTQIVTQRITNTVININNDDERGDVDDIVDNHDGYDNTGDDEDEGEDEDEVKNDSH